jgi:signal transduction histidine kinase
MTETDLLDRLAAHRTIGGVPREELAWLAAHGTILRIEAGERMSTKGVPIDSLYIVLAGHMAIYVERAGGKRRVLAWESGDIAGLLPYSRMVSPPGDSVAEDATTLLAIHRDHFRELIRECHEVTSICVHTMLDRARAFTSSDLHDEKMVSLGKLSAGLAHELNNPASAIERSATLLLKKLTETERAARSLGGVPLSAAQIAAVDALRESCLVAPVQGVRSPIEQAEREDAIADWLAGHGLDAAAAEALAETAVTVDSLDRAAAAIEGPALGGVLRWVAAGCAVRSLAADIQEASMRISGLVLAVKGFTHMDQAAIAEPVDLRQSVANTIAVLRAKARGKSAAIDITIDPGLPRVRGYAGELNQVWANLIDNALDAIPKSGRVEVLAGRERDTVVVSIVDDGPGIRVENRDRIFDPFFTTKPMGQGTGLGLDIVRRLVRHNDGSIAFESRPGRTEFRVTLPIAAEDAGGDAA